MRAIGQNLDKNYLNSDLLNGIKKEPSTIQTFSLLKSAQPKNVSIQSILTHPTKDQVIEELARYFDPELGFHYYQKLFKKTLMVLVKYKSTI